MSKKQIIIALLVLFAFGLWAQQGKYQRKSISSIESVWLSNNASQNKDFTTDFYKDMLELYIKISRFDYNELPESSLKDFRNRANALSTIRPEALTEILQQTLLKDIEKVLSDPDIQRVRGLDIEDESARIQLARVKGREYGLTEDMIEILMNSAYIYLPYISSISQKLENSTHSCTVEGGILWYRVHIASDGSASLILRQSATSSGLGSADASKQSLFSSDTFQVGEKSYKTYPSQYALYDAVQAMMKNLSVKMKEMPEFSLSAQIIERLPGNRYSAELGMREGVFLDDGYYIVDLFENAKGEIQKRTIGYARITKNADNRQDRNRYLRSIAQAHYGKRIMEGAMLMENPRLGTEVSLNVGSRNGLSIPKEAANGLYLEDAKSALEINANLAYNLAPITGITQFFYDLELSYGLPIVEYSSSAINTFAYTFAAYTGVSRRFWQGRHALAVSAKIGYDRFVTTSSDMSVATNAAGGKAGMQYSFMLSPNLHLNLGVDHKFGSAPFSTSYIIDGEEVDSTSAQDDVILGGTMFKIGFNYALGQLPVNIFGWLDPYKKH